MRESWDHTIDHMRYSSQSLAHSSLRDRKALQFESEILRFSCSYLGKNNTWNTHEIVSIVKLGLNGMLPFAIQIMRATQTCLPRWSQIAWTLIEWNPFRFTKSGSFSWGAFILTWVPSMHPIAQGKPPTLNKPCFISSRSARVHGNFMKSPNFTVKAFVTRRTIRQSTCQIPKKCHLLLDETNPKLRIWGW